MFQVSRKNILILEDHDSCQYIYKAILAGKNNLTFASSITEFLNLVKAGATLPDLLVLDIKLPDGLLTDHLESSLIQKFFTQVPTLVVSAMGDVEMIRHCYDQGIIDYLVKPFNSSELVIRLERLLQFKLRNFFLQEKSALTATEMQIIELFFKKSSLTVQKDELKSKIWNHVNVVPKTIDVHMSNLRKKLLPMGFSIKYLKDHSWQLISAHEPSSLE